MRPQKLIIGNQIIFELVIDAIVGSFGHTFHVLTDSVSFNNPVIKDSFNAAEPAFLSILPDSS